jgi:hypothetical protein
MQAPDARAFRVYLRVGCRFRDSGLPSEEGTVSASLDLAPPKLGSGARFRKLSATLAARGATDPDALAAFIGRKRNGGTSLANPDLGIYLAETTKDDQGKTLVCPECGHIAPSGDFGASGTSVDSKPGILRTPAPSTGAVRDGVPLTVRGGAAHALANGDYSGIIDLDWAAWDAEHGSHGRGGESAAAKQKAHDTASATAKRRMKYKSDAFKPKSPADMTDDELAAWRVTARMQRKTAGGLKPSVHEQRLAAEAARRRTASKAKAGGVSMASTRSAVELATGTVRRPIHGPMDVLVKRADDGSALLKHRHGGATIASLRRTDNGKWLATVNGKDLEPRDHQRTALMEAVGTWNKAVTGAVRPQAAPLQPEPQQSALMAEYGIPAMRSAAFATPTAGAGDGPKMTTSASAGTDDNGLSPKAAAVYKKLLAKGFPQARALAFAKNSERFSKAG